MNNITQTHTLTWQDNTIHLNKELVFSCDKDIAIKDIPKHVYQIIGVSYAKFFKMDILSKIGFLAAEILVKNIPIHSYNKDKIATIIATESGCIEIDKQYDESTKTFASPALFVYTLPNIMLGEVCIRNGFKGEQLCLINSKNEMNTVDFYIQDLMKNHDTQACLYGFIEATHHRIDVELTFSGK